VRKRSRANSSGITRKALAALLWRTERTKLAVCLAVCSVCVLGAAAPARGDLVITAIRDFATSDKPSFDSNVTRIIPIMEAAVAYWEDIVEDDWALTVTYYYDDLPDGNQTLGSHNNLGVSGGRATSARIRFDTQLNGVDRLWYYDPTPEDHSEYNISQTLYRDLTGTQPTDWFTGSPPSLLEVGYRGSATGNAPPDAQNGFDMLSTAIHELGHALGLTQNVGGGVVGNNGYNINPNLVAGATMTVVDNQVAHLAPTTALMCSGCGSSALRRLPSAADVLAVAAASNWTEIDLPREDFLSGSFWQTDINWEGGREPDAVDAAFIRHGGAVALQVNDDIWDLSIADDSELP